MQTLINIAFIISAISLLIAIALYISYFQGIRKEKKNAGITGMDIRNF